MKKKSTKKAKERFVDWCDKWCAEHIDQLLEHRGMIITVHPRHGIVGVANTLTQSLARDQFLRRSIMMKSYHVNVDATLVRVGWKEPTKRPSRKKNHPGWSKVREPSDPIPQWETPDLSPVDLPDVDDNTPSKSHRMKLIDYAKLRDQKATNVLLKLIEWGHQDINIHTELDEATLDQLDLHYKVTTAIHELVSGSNPFPSPHKQPDFMPMKMDHDDAVIDGAGAHYYRSIRSRGPTFD